MGSSCRLFPKRIKYLSEPIESNIGRVSSQGQERMPCCPPQPLTSYLYLWSHVNNIDVMIKLVTWKLIDQIWSTYWFIEMLHSSSCDMLNLITVTNYCKAYYDAKPGINRDEQEMKALRKYTWDLYYFLPKGPGMYACVNTCYVSACLSQ
jgi:hypothetical protein